VLNGRIGDPEGDRIDRQERVDRIAEKVGIDYFGPGDRCPVCGCIPKPLFAGMYVCGCLLPVGA
jgi:hypothetical protein